ALVLAFVIQRWAVQPFHIPSRSMEETLMVGDRVLVHKLVYQARDIARAGVIVCNGGGSWDEGSDVVVHSGAYPISRLCTWVGQARRRLMARRSPSACPALKPAMA